MLTYFSSFFQSSLILLIKHIWGVSDFCKLHQTSWIELFNFLF